MKTLIFAVAGYNLAETSRHIEIAKACRAHFDILFLSYGGQFERFIEAEGFTLHKMEPRLTKEKLNSLKAVLRGETLNTVGYFNAKELSVRVKNEVEFFRKKQPAAVLTGWCLSVLLSARAAKVPLVNVLHSTSIREYYEAGLQSFPDNLNYGFLRWFVSQVKLDNWFSGRVLRASFPTRPYNSVGAEYGLPPFNNFIEALEPDHILLADIPSWVNLPKLRPKVHHIGPLVAKLDLDIPAEIGEMPRDRPIIYFAMGSSGSPQTIKEIISGFRNKPYRVIAPVKALVEKSDFDVPSNVIVTGFIPAHVVNPLASLSVIHGGQNTVMNACLSGTPIVGVGNHPEQQANLDACVRKGFAIRIRKRELTAAAVLEAIDSLLNDLRAHRAVQELRDELQKWDGPSNAAKFLLKTFGSNVSKKEGKSSI